MKEFLNEEWLYNEWPEVDINGNVIEKKTLTEGITVYAGNKFNVKKYRSAGECEISGKMKSISAQKLYDSLLDLSYDFEDGDYMPASLSFDKTEDLSNAISTISNKSKDAVSEADNRYEINSDMEDIFAVISEIIQVSENIVLNNVLFSATSYAID